MLHGPLPVVTSSFSRVDLTLIRTSFNKKKLQNKKKYRSLASFSQLRGDQKQETFFFGLMLDNIVLQCQQSFLFLDHVGNPHNPWHMDVWEFLHDYLLDYMLLAEIMGITNMIQANLLDDMWLAGDY